MCIRDRQRSSIGRSSITPSLLAISHNPAQHRGQLSSPGHPLGASSHRPRTAPSPSPSAVLSRGWRLVHAT
eukprot:120154-Alexandrium_andersonii.AAC.1